MTPNHPHKVGDTWYRYEDVRYATMSDEWGESTGSYTVINMYEYTVRKVTPKGVWISQGTVDNPRFVLLSATKRYAAPTKAEALESLIARRMRQCVILEHQLNRAKETIQLAQKQLGLVLQQSGVIQPQPAASSNQQLPEILII